MAAAANLENTQKGYLGQFLIDLHQIWCACRYGQYKCHQGSKMSLFENSRWRRPPSCKIHKRAYLGQFLIDLHKIWCACRYGQYKCHQRTKMSLFENSRWRQPPCRKIHKRASFGQFLSDLHQIWCACRYGQYKVISGLKCVTFWKFKMAAAAILENTQKGVSGPILDQFTPNLVCWYILSLIHIWRCRRRG